MARGANKREGRAARSELPSGVEATRADIGALQAEKLYADRRVAYAEKFEEKSEFKSFGKVNAGDGQVGNGIIKNGTLFLRDEDIDEIVASNFGESDVLQELIRDGGGSQPFALFVGENNLVDPRTQRPKPSLVRPHFFTTMRWGRHLSNCQTQTITMLTTLSRENQELGKTRVLPLMALWLLAIQTQIPICFVLHMKRLAVSPLM